MRFLNSWAFRGLAEFERISNFISHLFILSLEFCFSSFTNSDRSQAALSTPGFQYLSHLIFRSSFFPPLFVVSAVHDNLGLESSFSLDEILKHSVKHSVRHFVKPSLVGMLVPGKAALYKI